MSRRAGLIWVDPQGERVLHVLTTRTGVGAVEAALEAASNGGVVECWEGQLEVYSPSTSASVYPTVRTSAVLYFHDGSGSGAKVIVPAPKAALFLPDGVTIDPSNSEVQAIVTACIGSLICGSGNPATTFAGGQLVQTKLSGIATVS